jgi:hypothetical protein
VNRRISVSSSPLFQTGVTLAAAVLSIAVAGQSSAPTPAEAVVWRLDSLERVGGHAVSAVGAPRVVQTDIGPAVEFNGTADGLFVETNPLSGLERFTIEVLFQPAADGPAEQRFLHIEAPGTDSRALIELRMLPGAMWSLDTYLRSHGKGLTLLDRGKVHPVGRWYGAALTYDGRNMTHYVNGQPEHSGVIAFAAASGGRTSIGMRQNKVSWFKGRIHSVRVTPEALPPDRLLRAPAVGFETMPVWPEGAPGAVTRLAPLASRFTIGSRGAR